MKLEEDVRQVLDAPKAVRDTLTEPQKYLFDLIRGGRDEDSPAETGDDEQHSDGAAGGESCNGT